ncbi:hypothetical protein CBM2585_B80373 [Cupriavidus taiwanensis]|nr:hypothetical protein CBM2585_B80373 [Cupriavidus taiwanensis]
MLRAKMIRFILRVVLTTINAPAGQPRQTPSNAFPLLTKPHEHDFPYPLVPPGVSRARPDRGTAVLWRFAGLPGRPQFRSVGGFQLLRTPGSGPSVA